MNFLAIILSFLLIYGCVGNLPKGNSRKGPPIVIDGPKTGPRLPIPIPLPRQKADLESPSPIMAEFPKSLSEKSEDVAPTSCRQAGWKPALRAFRIGPKPELSGLAIEGQKERPVVRPLPKLRREGERRRQLWWPGRVSDDLLPEEEVLRRLDITLQTLTKLRERGLPYFEPIKLKRFYFEEDVLEWLMKYKGSY